MGNESSKLGTPTRPTRSFRARNVPNGATFDHDDARRAGRSLTPPGARVLSSTEVDPGGEPYVDDSIFGSSARRGSTSATANAPQAEARAIADRLTEIPTPNIRSRLRDGSAGCAAAVVGGVGVGAGYADTRSTSDNIFSRPCPPPLPSSHSFASSSLPKHHSMSFTQPIRTQQHRNSMSTNNNNSTSNNHSYTNGSYTSPDSHAVHPGSLPLSRSLHHDASGAMFSSNRAEVSVASVPRYVKPGSLVYTPVVVNHHTATASAAPLSASLPSSVIGLAPVTLPHVMSAMTSSFAATPGSGGTAAMTARVDVPEHRRQSSSLYDVAHEPDSVLLGEGAEVAGVHTPPSTPSHHLLHMPAMQHKALAESPPLAVRRTGVTTSDRMAASPSNTAGPPCAEQTPVYCHCSAASPPPPPPSRMTQTSLPLSFHASNHMATTTTNAAAAAAAAALSASMTMVSSTASGVVPQYSLTDAFAGEAACSNSLVLRSYRQSSLSCADFLPTPSPMMRTGGSHHAMVGSPTHRGFPFGSSVLLDAEETVVMEKTGRTPLNAPKLDRHTRYQEITGYPLGLENYGNTCYINSVIQLLYHCTPLRLRLLELQEVYEGKKGGAGFEENSVLHQLCKLVALMHKSNNDKQEKRKKHISPTQFLRCVRAKNADFAQPVQHDAHEFAMFILNDIMETEKRIMGDPKNIALLSETKRKSGVSSLAFWRHGHSKTHHTESSLAPSSSSAAAHAGNGRGAAGGLLGVGDGRNNNNTSINSNTSVHHSSNNSISYSDEYCYVSSLLQSTSQAGGGGGSYFVSGGSAAPPSAAGTRSAFGSPMCDDTHAVADRRGSRCEGHGASAAADAMTPLQSILQGVFGSLTACLECNKVTARKEVFIDISLETAQGSSLLKRLHHFGDPELFYGNNKLYCERCARSVNAAKTIHIKHLPPHVLLIHLKRFQYDPHTGEFAKTSDHVALPMEMDVEEYLAEPSDEPPPDTTRNGAAHAPVHSCEDETRSEPNRVANASSPGTPTIPELTRQKLRGVPHHKARFSLTGFAVHSGKGANLGHYFTCIRYGPNLWRRFDDETVSTMTEREVQQYFGVPIPVKDALTTTAYLLLYERNA